MGGYIVVSDTHFHNWTEFSKPDEEYVNSRLREQIEVMREVFELARERNAGILFAGDMFHKRQSVDTRVFNAVYDLFEENSDVYVAGIPGNHDKVTNSLKSESSIDIFNYIDYTHIAVEPEQINPNNSVCITLVPYGDEVADIKEYLKGVKVDTNKTNILVAHLGISGGLVGSGGHRLEGAFAYSDLQPDKFDYIMLGHYHRPQQLSENDKHIYVGPLTQNSFGEEGYDTGVVYLDYENNTIERIPIKSTKFVTISGDDIPEDIEEIIENSYIRFTGDRGQAKAIENMVEDLSNVRVQIEELKEVETRIDIDESTNPIDITEKYMDEYYPDATDEAIECLKEAMSNVEV